MDNNILYCDDCLNILRDHIADESIDLIYLDPPFNTGKDFGTGFIDKWKWNRESVITLTAIIKRGAPFKLIELLTCLVSVLDRNSLAAYLVMMTPRLVELHRVLKSTGSIYLHCDYRTSHYLKLILDQIFGMVNFRNEIVWQRDAVGKGAKKISKQWSRELDIIYWYSKSETYIFEQQFYPHDKLSHTQLKEFRYRENNERLYKIVTLGDYSQKSIDRMKEQNLIHTTSTGKEYKKYYLDEFQLAIGSLWNDIPNLSHGKNPEVVGYPTQKPEKLLERIIKASSNENDLVLDPMCGCGTTLVVAERLNRKWIGIDNNLIAIEITKKRLGI